MDYFVSPKDGYEEGSVQAHPVKTKSKKAAKVNIIDFNTRMEEVLILNEDEDEILKELKKKIETESPIPKL